MVKFTFVFDAIRVLSDVFTSYVHDFFPNRPKLAAAIGTAGVLFIVIPFVLAREWG